MAETPVSLSYAGSLAAASLTANGSTTVIGPLTVTMAGFDLTGSQAECTLGRGGGISSDVPAGNTPAGSTDFGFTDTTYALTATQIAAGSLMGA